MGIPLKTGKNSKRRSYADIKPKRRRPNPNDPVRVVFYLIALLVVGVWAYFNRDQVLPMLFNQPVEQAAVAQPDAATRPPIGGGGLGGQEVTPTPARSAVEVAAEAEQAYLAGNIDEALAAYQQASEIDPNNPLYAFEVARLLVYESALQYGTTRQETLDDAMDWALQAMASGPERPEGYAIAGKIMDWQGNPQGGQNEVTRALTNDENFALAYSYLAEIQMDLDRPEEALASIQQAIALSPNSVDVLRDYGYILETQGDYVTATDLYEQAVDLNPGLTYLRLALARNYRVLAGIYSDIAYCENSISQLTAAQQQEPGNALIAYEIGRTEEVCLGDQPAAIEAYEQAIEFDQNYISPWIRLGAIRYFAASYTEATIALERAIELGAESRGESTWLSINYQLGYAYAAEGQCTEAEPHLAIASDLVGENELIQDVITEAYDLCAIEAPEETP